MKDNNIELRAEKMQELLGSTPTWLMRWGITVFFSVIVALLIFSAFFRYPQTYQAPIVITTEHPAVWVVAQTSGKLDSIFISNNSNVTKNQVIAIIHNSTNFADITSLKSFLDYLKPLVVEFDFKEVELPTQMYVLGELQDTYNQLFKILTEYQMFCLDKFHQQQKQMIKDELVEYETYLVNVNNQAKTRVRIDELSNNQFLRDSMLFKVKAISTAELEKTEQQHLYNNIEVSQSELAINSARINIIKLNQSLIELQNDFNNKTISYRTTIKAIYEQLCSKIALWDNSYVLKAPIDGKINFSTLWSKNQYVNLGEKSFAVIAHNAGKVIGRCNFSVNGIGKIMPNQNVTIKLDGYPYMEYGMLRGLVENISSVPVDITGPTGSAKFVSTDISLSNGFISTYKYEIPFSGELTGIAEITTKDMTLLEQLFNPLKYLWNKNLKSTK